MLCKENIEEIAVEKSIFPADILVRVILFPAKLKLILEIHWYDHRLEFNNLKNMTSMNTIPEREKEQLWLPPVIFFNTETRDGIINDEKASYRR